MRCLHADFCVCNGILAVAVVALSVAQFACGVSLYPFSTGNDDRKLEASDDGSSRAVVLDTAFPFFASKEDTIYVRMMTILSRVSIRIVYQMQDYDDCGNVKIMC